MAKRGGKSDKAVAKKATAPKKKAPRKAAAPKMSPETKRVVDTLQETFEFAEESCYTCDGLEDALIGWVQIFNKRVALYDREKCIEVFVSQGMSFEEAEEHFEFNVVGAYIGEMTPAFATIVRDRPDSMYVF